jgi:Type IV secretion-system coupling protein DNA-binding domain
MTHAGLYLLGGYGISVACVSVGLRIRRVFWREYVRAPLLGLVALAVAIALMLAAQSALTAAHAPAVVADNAPLLLLPLTAFMAAWWRRAGTDGHLRGAWVAPAVRTPGPRARRGQITIAGQPVPETDETKHTKLFGTTGAGKTTAIREVLSGALARGDRAVIADPDGGYLSQFYQPSRGDQILNPFDVRGAPWDLRRELQDPYDADQLARSLIGDDVGENQIWFRFAQTLLSGILQKVYEGYPADAREIHRLITIAPVEELRSLLAGTPACAFLPEANAKMLGSVRTTATSRLSGLAFCPPLDERSLSIRDWVRKGRGVLFLPYRAGQIATLRHLISTWMRLAIFEVLDGEEGDIRIWFAADELDALGAIDGLKDALARLRKFGGRCLLGIQSIGQVSGLYGVSDAQTIVENCGNTLLLRCSASDGGGTAQFASKLIGDREVLREHLTRTGTGGFFDRAKSSQSRSLQHVIEPAVLPSEIEQLPDLVGYLKLASYPTWHRVTLAR